MCPMLGPDKHMNLLGKNPLESQGTFRATRKLDGNFLQEMEKHLTCFESGKFVRDANY